VTEVLGLKKRF